MMSRSLRRVLLGFILLRAIPLAAENVGASFLKIGAGARAAGMGSVFTAGADDAAAHFWNPAGLARLDRRQFMAAHAQWIEDVRCDHLAYAHPLPSGTLSAGAVYLSHGRLESRGEKREYIGTFQAQDAAAGFAWSGDLSSRSSYGLGIKAIQQRIAGATASGWAADAGWRSEWGRRITVGFAARDLGPRMKFLQQTYRLPLTVSSGITYATPLGLRLGADWRRSLYDGAGSLGIGAEQNIFGRTVLRTGYLSRSSDAQLSPVLPGRDSSRPGPAASLSMGFGLKFALWELDYAVSSVGELGEAHIVSFAVKL
jgi:hypothetical protein